MAHYSFRKDLEDSKKGVKVVSDYMARKYNVKIRELVGKEEQKRGDILVETTEPFTVEVKFDIMAAKTGNLCFEMDNGKKLTGILATKANRIVYVVPNGSSEKFKLYVFSTPSLLAFVTNTDTAGRFRFVRGGDGGKFGMLLVPSSHEVIESLAEEIVECQITTTNAPPV
jgi:hypothetical protein